MDLNALRHFYWVVREGNFTNASRAIRTAQPAISRSVRKLEGLMGGALLVRHKRKVELTPLGNSIFLQCQIIFQAAEHIKDLSDSSPPEIGGSLSLGTADIIAEYLLPSALQQLSHINPKLHSSVQVGPTSFMLSRIVARELDVGIFFHVPTEPNPDLEIRRIARVQFKLVVDSKFAKNSDTLIKFLGSREVDSPNTRSYPTLEKLRKIHQRAAIHYSSNHLGLHKRLVLLGMGVAVLPIFSIREELKRGRLKDLLPKEHLEFDLKLVRHKHRPPSRSVRELVAVLEEVAVR
ncbi:MAG: LysR family transcriptional regulator [Bdellovibrionales bacterium]|nr:LysR family transcriptional regulator [Bdellovibrionales bacterium]